MNIQELKKETSEHLIAKAEKLAIKPSKLKDYRETRLLIDKKAKPYSD